MLCQNCGKNEATIHLYANVGGQRKQLIIVKVVIKKLKVNKQQMRCLKIHLALVV